MLVKIMFPFLSAYVRLPVVCFLWDQYMIGMDSPGFHDDYLPAMMAIYLMLLQDKLRECLTVSLNGHLCFPSAVSVFLNHIQPSVMDISSYIAPGVIQLFMLLYSFLHVMHILFCSLRNVKKY